MATATFGHNTPQLNNLPSEQVSGEFKESTVAMKSFDNSMMQTEGARQQNEISLRTIDRPKESKMETKPIIDNAFVQSICKSGSSPKAIDKSRSSMKGNKKRGSIFDQAAN